MAVDSHIQIPKGVLKHFADHTHRVYYLDTKTEYIINGQVDSFKRRNNYFFFFCYNLWL